MPLATPTLGGMQFWSDIRLAGGFRIQRSVLTGHARLLSPRDFRLCSGSVERCEEQLAQRVQRGTVPPSGPHLVLGLHGIFRSRHALSPMMRALRLAGFQAWALNYPSTRQSLERSAADLDALIARLVGVTRLSIVAHSMGGLLARVLLGSASNWRERIAFGGLVTIASPHGGAEMADHLGTTEVFRLVAGPAGQQLSTRAAPGLPLPRVETLTVAGVRGDGRGYNSKIAGDDDMTVGAWATHFPGERAHLEVHAVHTFVQSHPAVIAAATHFLRERDAELTRQGAP